MSGSSATAQRSVGGDVFTFIGIILLSAVACGTSDSKTIRQSDYGDKWPLTVPEATLLCKGGLSVYIYVNERYYPVNGSAQAQWIIDRYIGGPVYALEDIWAVDEEMMENVRKAYEYTGKVMPPDEPLFRIHIGPLIDDGLTLCK